MWRTSPRRWRWQKGWVRVFRTPDSRFGYQDPDSSLVSVACVCRLHVENLIQALALAAEGLGPEKGHVAAGQVRTRGMNSLGVGFGVRAFDVSGFKV